MWNDIVILAAENYWDSAARYLNRASTYRENLLLLLFAAVIAGIWITLLIWERFRDSKPSSPASPVSLFEELCQAHRLGKQEMILLVDAAQECRLPNPSFLFVQPECLDRLSGHGLPKAEVYRQLRERLFGNL